VNALLLNANALHIPLASGSVHMCVTSPPYWSLRNYQVDGQLGLEPLHDCGGWVTGDNCGECYVCHMRQVFAEVWRVLRDDGVVFLNLGDSYNGSGGAGGDYNEGGLKAGQPRYPGHRAQSLKPKDLVGIPWRVAFALQADGWWLRSEITWCKLNPMPEPALDRPTSATEKIFLFAKSSRYFYDQAAVRENFADERHGQDGARIERIRNVGGRTDGFTTPNGWNNPNGNSGRNQRNWWALAAEPYAGAHFATYPTEIPRRAIKAGTSQAGCCPACGAPWKRVVERESFSNWRERSGRDNGYGRADTNAPVPSIPSPAINTTGWSPTCTCDAGDPIPATVLDVFSGAATTGLVAQQLGRRYVGLDLSPDYLRLSRERLGMDALDAWTNGLPAQQAGDLGPLFTLPALLDGNAQ
jgi:DNA modification methylase